MNLSLFGGFICIFQQIYGYEDLHMLQSRLPMVSIVAARSEKLASGVLTRMWL